MHWIYKTPKFLALTLLLVIFSTTTHAAQTVHVLAYKFPPYVNEDLHSGLTFDIVSLLNRRQSKFHFEIVPTSPNRRYNDFKNHTGDLILFEMPEWGWEKAGVDYIKTNVFSGGGEVYITAASNYSVSFKNFEDKSIAAYQGYHYGFAQFNANPNELHQQFNIKLFNSHERIIQLVAEGKIEIGVVTHAFLKQYLKKNPSYQNKLRISSQFDQHYALRSLVHPESPISPNEFESLIAESYRDGALKKILKSYNISSQWKLDQLSVIAFDIPNVIQQNGQGVYDQILHQAAQDAGINLDIKVVPVARARALYKSGEFDCLLPLDPAFEHQYEEHLTSIPLSIAQAYIFTKKEKPILRSVQEIENLRVGAELGIPYPKAIQKITRKNLGNGLNILLTMLQHDRFEAVIGYNPDVLQYLEEHNLSNIQFDPKAPVSIYKDSLTCRPTSQIRPIFKKLNRSLAKIVKTEL